MHLENLFGTPAENRRITAQLTLSPSIPSFRAFPDYSSTTRSTRARASAEQLAETTTDAQGEATLALNLQRFARATYRMHLVAQGFEADGGRGVTAEAAQLVSSMPFLIGYKADGDLELPVARRRAQRAPDRDRSAGAAHGRRQAGAGATRDALRLGAHAPAERHIQIRVAPQGDDARRSSRWRLPPPASTLPLATDAPGNFAYVVRDAQGEQLARFDYQVAGEGNVTRALEKNAELELALSKRDYAPGEEIELSIRAPYAGAGLITIERERVYAWHWFKTTTTSSVQRIQLPEGLEGNAYVSVTFVRDAGSREIYTSPLSYGVQPFSIDVDARRNQVTVRGARARRSRARR